MRAVRKFVSVISSVSILAVGCSGGGSKSSPPPGPTPTSVSSCAQVGLPATVAYNAVPGVDRNLTSLDIFASRATCEAPVVMWVHGGGYQIGDKSNQVKDKVVLFNDHGWIFVSVNYRLTKPGQPGSAQYPDHYDDVASAVAWVHAHIADYGGNPSRIALFGHSAGADIVANVAVNPTYLQRQGLGLSAIRCAGPLDTEGFDKVAAGARDPDGEKQQWKAALGNNPRYLTQTSAALLARPGIGIPRMIGVVRGTPQRQEIETAFLDRLRAAGVPTTSIDARSLTHGQVNNQIGAAHDKVMTPPLVDFLRNCFTT